MNTYFNKSVSNSRFVECTYITSTELGDNYGFNCYVYMGTQFNIHKNSDQISWSLLRYT